MCFAVALKLKQRVRDVENWPIREICEWAAYFELMERRKDK